MTDETTEAPDEQQTDLEPPEDADEEAITQPDVPEGDDEDEDEERTDDAAE